MRHLKTGRKFNRNTGSRKAMLRNLSIALLDHELIKTTLPKVKELRTIVEPLITLAKREMFLRKNTEAISTNKFNSRIVALRREVFNYLRNKSTVIKLFEEIAPRYEMRPGGYTRLFKCGYRFGDKAPMAFIELVDRCTSPNNSSTNEKLSN